MSAHKAYLKKCEKFSLCLRVGDADFIGCEHVVDRLTQYHYGLRGSGTFGIAFSDKTLDFKSDGTLVDVRPFLNEYTIYKSDEPFYMIGFNSLHKSDNWNGELVKESFMNTDNDSWLVCFDGHPVVNGKELKRFDYAELHHKQYDVSLNDGVLAKFTLIEGLNK